MRELDLAALRAALEAGPFDAAEAGQLVELGLNAGNRCRGPGINRSAEGKRMPEGR
jgi:hypothetical protein